MNSILVGQDQGVHPSSDGFRHHLSEKILSRQKKIFDDLLAHHFGGFLPVWPIFNKISTDGE